MQRNLLPNRFPYLIRILIGASALITTIFAFMKYLSSKKIIGKKNSFNMPLIAILDDKVPLLPENYIDPFELALKRDEANRGKERKNIYEQLKEAESSSEGSSDQPTNEEENVALIKARRKVMKANQKKAKELHLEEYHRKQAALALSTTNFETLQLCGFKINERIVINGVETVVNQLPFEFRDQNTQEIIEGIPVKIRGVANTGYFTRKYLIGMNHPIDNRPIIDADLEEFPLLKAKIDLFIQRCVKVDFNKLSARHQRRMVDHFRKAWELNHSTGFSHDSPKQPNPDDKNKMIKKVNFDEPKSSRRFFDLNKAVNTIANAPEEKVTLEP